MSESTIDLKVNNSQAVGALRAVENQVNKLSNSFTSLRGVLSGLALGALVQNSLQLATSIQNVATATGISTQTITEFTSAISANGGSAQEAAGKIVEFTARLAEARTGSIQLQSALNEAGISLNDLRKLSEQELLTKTIQGLAKIEDSSKRNRLAVQLLGDEFKKIDVKNVAASIGTGGGANAAAIKAAAEAQRNLSKQFDNLTMAITNVLRPLNEIVASINVTTRAFESLIKAVVALGAAYVVFKFGLAAVTGVMNGLATSIRASGGVFAWVAGTLILMKNNIVQVFTNLGRMTGILKGGTSAVFSFAASIAAVLRFMLRFAGLTGVIYGVAQAVDFLLQLFLKFSIIDWITDKFNKLWEATKRFFDLREKMPDQTDAESDRLKRLNDSIEERKKKEKEDVDALKNQRQAVEDILNNFKKQNSEVSEQLGLQTRLVGKSEDEAEAINAQYELYKKYRTAREELEKKLRDLTPEERRLGLGQALTKAQQDLTAEFERESKYVDDMVLRLQGARTIEADRLRTLEQMNNAYQQQAQRAQALGDILRNARGQLEDVMFERTQGGRSPIDQQFEQIRENARKAALEAGRAFAAAFEDGGDGLTPERAKELQDGLDAIANAYKNIADAQLDNLRISLSWEQGWQQAFMEYADNATNAANRARETFSSVTRAMESAIDRFVETGKFSFKDFTRSVLADLLKIELKAAAMNFFGSMKGNFLSSLFSSFAGFFAQGGYIPPGKSGIVGEAGPELVTGPANVTPMGQLQGSTTIVNNYNISAIDSRSVAQFFAENRRTMLGATEQARKELPIRQRF